MTIAVVTWTLLCCISASGANVSEFVPLPEVHSSELNPLPVSFGPASVPYVLTIQKILLDLHGSRSLLDRLWHEYDGSYDNEWDRFFVESNMRAVKFATMQRLVIAWLKSCGSKGAAQHVIHDALQNGLPAIGRKGKSKVVGGRAAQKWFKASEKLVAAFDSVSDYRDSMLMLQFEYLPHVLRTLGNASLTDGLEHAKTGNVGGQTISYSVDTRRLTMTATGESLVNEAPTSITPKDSFELLRYVAFYLCRETSPPTMLDNFSFALAGWAYGEAEERALSAVHYPLFERQIEEHDVKPPNRLRSTQQKMYRTYVERHRTDYQIFQESLRSPVHVGGAGRVSAEISRDLSKIQGVKTIAVDHRRSAEDYFKNVNAASDFFKELAKDPGHLPTFQSRSDALKYRQLFDSLSKHDRTYRKLLANLARILQANQDLFGYADLSDGGVHETLNASSQFVLASGDRGSGDIVFAAPSCFRGAVPYEPSSMDAKIVEHLESILSSVDESRCWQDFEL